QRSILRPAVACARTVALAAVFISFRPRERRQPDRRRRDRPRRRRAPLPRRRRPPAKAFLARKHAEGTPRTRRALKRHLASLAYRRLLAWAETRPAMNDLT